MNEWKILKNEKEKEQMGERMKELKKKKILERIESDGVAGMKYLKELKRNENVNEWKIRMSEKSKEVKEW